MGLTPSSRRQRHRSRKNIRITFNRRTQKGRRPWLVKDRKYGCQEQFCTRGRKKQCRQKRHHCKQRRIKTFFCNSRSKAVCIIKKRFYKNFRIKNRSAFKNKHFSIKDKRSFQSHSINKKRINKQSLLKQSYSVQPLIQGYTFIIVFFIFSSPEKQLIFYKKLIFKQFFRI